MKAVNQGTGRDLDPNNVIAEYAFHVLCVSALENAVIELFYAFAVRI